MTPHIPQELIAAALEYLRDEHESLLQCALVDRSWRYPAQSSLFHTISLGVGVQDGSAPGLVDMPPLGEALNLSRKFLDLLLESPHLALQIQTLNVVTCLPTV
ncbi:hypothetical protein B0H13DRAFT_2386265 [Mycena leptocephala]|nr:hypothetical protein B0H13DRAFT_2386265 [Mycena leptocephala]